ncbi:MAG TPA: c-type cytochrome [Acidisphaera sp.]|nr:c-type cytochrome [Acidisphaera sp.]
MPVLRAGLLAAAVAAGPAARAQFTVPTDVGKPDGASVFLNQCGTCHSLDPNEQRQGPTLKGVYGRRAGSVAGFSYSAGFAKADFTWDETRLNAWLTNPPSVIPGAVMPYRQPDAEIRETIIAYLKEQH